MVRALPRHLRPGRARYPYDVTESELLELQRRYGFHYAVLPVGAGMSFPVLASSGD